MEIKQIQIIYAPGTWGNTLRWMLDRFSQDSQLKHMDSPWDDDNRSHHYVENQHLYSEKFIRAHPEGCEFSEPVDTAEKVVINFKHRDIVFAERCGFLRNPGYEDNNKRYSKIIQQADPSFIKESFGEVYNSRNVAKEIYKIQFHDINEQVVWKSMLDHINDKTHHQFDMYALTDTERLVVELESISNRFDLNLNIEKNVVKNVTDRIKESHVFKTKDRVFDILDAIVSKDNVDCANLDIVEQAFIETEFEKTHDSVLFPYGCNWFRDTKEINEFLDTFPKYLRHMNPRLPWYNNIKNPFYLTGRIDKSDNR